jgi:hypothetical protein
MIIKNQKDFDNLLDKNKIQVFLCTSFLPIPLSFAVHPHFVVNNKGKINRWDVYRYDNYKHGDLSWGHIYRNILPYWEGISKSYLNTKNKFNIHIINSCEGEIAKKLIKVIEEAPKNYPNKDYYRFVRAPNSNSYAQWIINQVPQSNFKLPLNAIGRGYYLNGKNQ